MAGRTGVTVIVKSNRLPQMPAAIHAAVVAEVSKAAYDVEAKAKAKAPVKTGTLRRSIHSVFERGGLTGIVGPSVRYGAYVELGTRHMAARPYMRPAAEAALPRFADAVKRALAGLR
jgi:HK97 gp10 family phage protein